MKKIVYILSLAFIALSCSNEEASIKMSQEEKSNSSSKVISFAEYYDFVNANSNDKVLVQHTKFINSTSALQNLSATRNNSNNPYLIKLNGNQFTPSYIYNSPSLSTYSLTDNSLSNFYGKKLELNFNGNIGLSLDDAANYDVYIPNILNVSVSNLSSNGGFIVGTQIIWNADPLNTNGVALLAEYSPNNQIDPSIASAYPNVMSGGITFEDTGKYTITSEDLKSYPKGSIIKFTIGRAGFILTNNGDVNEDLSFGAYTMVKGEYTIN